MSEVTPATGRSVTSAAPSVQSSSRGLLWTLAGSQFGLYIVFGAVPSVLLALQLAGAVGDARKAGVLAVVTAIGATAHMVCQPLFGLLSDRTRSKWGSRTPWALGGAIVVMPLLWAMGLSGHSVFLLALFYTLAEVALTAAEGPLGAVIPDRVAVPSRGRFGAARGLGVMIGTVAGQVLGGVLSHQITLAYLILSVLPLAFVVPRLVADPDPGNRDAPIVKTSLRQTLGSFRISGKQHPEFWWAFGSRLLTYVGFFSVYGYTLYLFEDYVGIGDSAAGKVSVFAAIAAVTLCASALPAGILSDRIGRRKVFVLASSCGLGLAFMIPLLWPTVGGMLAMGAVAGAAFGCYQAVDVALITQVLPRADSYGQDFGTFSLAGILPQVLAPALAGTIVVVSGGYVAIFPIAAVFAVVGGLLVLPIRTVR